MMDAFAHAQSVADHADEKPLKQHHADNAEIARADRLKAPNRLRSLIVNR